MGRQKRLTEQQREKSLLEMAERQREMMVKESKQIKEKDDMKVLAAQKLVKGSKGGKVQEKSGKLQVEKIVDTLDIQQNKSIDQEQQKMSRMFDNDRELQRSTKMLQNLDKNLRPQGRVNSRVKKEGFMQAYIFGEVDPEES